MDDLKKTLHRAGMSHLLTGGYRDPSRFIKAMMSKQKGTAPPYNRNAIVAPFQPDRVENPSMDIQRKYKNAPYRRFDYIAASINRDTRDREEEDDVARVMIRDRVTVPEAVRRYLAETRLHSEVMKPEYWGLTWADLQPSGRWYVTDDGLRFPPIPWTDPNTKRVYWGLACCGVEPAEGREKQRYKMLFFREGEAPNFPANASFGEETVRKARKAAAPNVAPRNRPFEEVGIRERETVKRGIRLIGTNKTLIKTPAQIAAQQAARRGGTRPKPAVQISAATRAAIRAELDRVREEGRPPPAPRAPRAPRVAAAVEEEGKEAEEAEEGVGPVPGGAAAGLPVLDIGDIPDPRAALEAIQAREREAARAARAAAPPAAVPAAAVAAAGPAPRTVEAMRAFLRGKNSELYYPTNAEQAIRFFEVNEGHPPTDIQVDILRDRFRHPDWSQRELAEASGAISTNFVNRLLGRPTHLTGVIYTVEGPNKRRVPRPGMSPLPDTV